MLEASQILNQRYQLQKQLGTNSIRVTWLATDLETQEMVVVKLLCFGGNVQWDELKLFEREALILKQLQHPRIPKYRDYFSLDDRTLWFGLVQEYIPGNNLKDLLTQGKRFSEKEIKNIATQVLEILHYLHALTPPVYHRDLKPSNLIMGEDSHIYLVDFGAVQDKAAREGVTFTVVGTYGYAPVEQFSGKASPASDLYALGASLVHLVTGVTPADLPTKELKLQFRHLINSSHDVVTWLEKMTEPIPEKRFQTALSALKDLQENKIFKNYSLVRPKNNKIKPPLNTKVQIKDTGSQLTITIPPRYQDLLHYQVILVICLILTLIFCFVFIYLKPDFFLPLILITVVVFSNLIVSETTSHKLNISRNHQFAKTTGFSQSIRVDYRDYTEYIQDISLKYLSQDNSRQKAECLMILTKYPGNALLTKYDFGKGLSEIELIWLAQVIRDWLNQ